LVLFIFFRFSFDDQAARQRLWNDKAGLIGGAGGGGGEREGGGGYRDVKDAALLSWPPVAAYATAVNLHFTSKTRDTTGVTLTFQTADASAMSPASFEIGDFVTLSTMQVRVTCYV
jgi:hypothetical protein